MKISSGLANEIRNTFLKEWHDYRYENTIEEYNRFKEDWLGLNDEFVTAILEGVDSTDKLQYTTDIVSKDTYKEAEDLLVQYIDSINEPVGINHGDKIEKNALQNQFDALLNILNVSEEDMFGGIIKADATIEQLNKMIKVAPNFWHETDAQNYSPKCREFKKFMEENPQFIAELYIVTPKREDYRISIEGIKAPLNEENKAKLYDWINSMDDNNPDEYGEYDGYIRAWWD